MQVIPKYFFGTGACLDGFIFCVAFRVCERGQTSWESNQCFIRVHSGGPMVALSHWHPLCRWVPKYLHNSLIVTLKLKKENMPHQKKKKRKKKEKRREYASKPQHINREINKNKTIPFLLSWISFVKIYSWWDINGRTLVISSLSSIKSGGEFLKDFVFSGF